MDTKNMDAAHHSAILPNPNNHHHSMPHSFQVSPFVMHKRKKRGGNWYLVMMLLSKRKWDENEGCDVRGGNWYLVMMLLSKRKWDENEGCGLTSHTRFKTNPIPSKPISSNN